MSSIKKFKSRISQKRSDSKSKINMSMSQSIIDCNLEKLLISTDKNIQLRLQDFGQTRLVGARIKITNQTGVRVFVHVIASKDEYFSISPKKYILQNGVSYQVTIKLIEIPYVKFQDYQSESFQINWGRISTEEIANKSIPLLSESRIFKCRILNKGAISEYFNRKMTGKNNLLAAGDHSNILNNSRARSVVQGDQFARSGLNATDLNTKDNVFQDRPTLLTRNIIIGVALVSFVIGLITA